MIVSASGCVGDARRNHRDSVRVYLDELISDLRKTYMYIGAEDQITKVTAVCWIWTVLTDGIDSTLNNNSLTVCIHCRVMPYDMTLDSRHFWSHESTCPMTGMDPLIIFFPPCN
jgi:hypothetical protein